MVLRFVEHLLVLSKSDVNPVEAGRYCALVKPIKSSVSVFRRALSQEEQAECLIAGRKIDLYASKKYHSVEVDGGRPQAALNSSCKTKNVYILLTSAITDLTLAACNALSQIFQLFASEAI